MRLELLGKGLRGNPSTAWRRSPSPFRGGFLGWEGFGVGGELVWEGGTLPPSSDGPPRTERSPLSLRDISPPRGESPLSGEALGLLFLL